MSVIGSNILAGASGQGGGYNLTNSLRFRSSASAYLNRTPASASNRTTWTWSAWVKRGDVASNDNRLFGAGTSNSDRALIAIENYISFVGTNSGSNVLVLQTTPVYRDPSAWYHIVIALDTTQATASNRAKIYVNGVQVTAFGTATYPAQNTTLQVNSANPHVIGTRGTYSVDSNFDGYLAEVNFIDGQALTPSSFGETSSTTGVWIPKKYTGTYGTNGFYLPFTDNSALTTSSNAGLGKDFSGNSNYWTTNNISITSGSTYDSMTDVPTLTSATTANYCVLNPLTNVGIGTVSNGNLQLVTSTNSRTMTGTMALPSTGQYYFEITATDYVTDGGTYLGIVNEAFIPTTPSNGSWLGILTYNASYQNGTSTDTNNLTGANATQDGDIWCFAIDVTNNKFWVGRSRSGTLVWADGVTPAVNGSGATTLSLPTGTLYPMAYRGGSFNETYNFNFGQQPFAHTPPTGFVRLNTFNLPTPTIGATASTTANKYFDATLYTGNGSTNTITNSGSMQPDLLWTKRRSAIADHYWQDSVRGVNKALFSDLTDSEYTITSTTTTLNNNGFSFNGGESGLNANTSTYVAWQWRASNTTAVTNTNGSITSTVSANTSAGFSIVTYTGNDTSGSTVGHGLGVAPSMMIIKERSQVRDWTVYHISTGNTGGMRLNGTGANETTRTGWFNNTSPSSSVFTLGGSSGNDWYQTNQTGQTYVAYCFAQVAGYSAFGSYTGNGSSDGTFIFTGFRPRYVMTKRSDAIESWRIGDSARSPYNAVELELFANLSNAEENNSNPIDYLSNGFKIRTSSSSHNASGGTYIYMVFAESPFKFANAR